MSNIHYRKIVRDLFAHKTRTFLVILSVFIGVLGVVVLTTLGALLTRQMEKDIRPDELAMLRAYLNIPATGEPIDNAAVMDWVRGIDGVEKVEGQAVYGFNWRLPDQTEYEEGQLFSYTEPFGEIALEPIRLLSGEYPAVGMRELAIEKRMADRYDLKIGDRLYLSTRTFPNFEVWQVVGIVFQPYIYLGSSTPETSVYMNYADAQHIVGFRGLSSLYVRFTDFRTAQQASTEFRAVLDQETPYDIAFHLLDDPQENSFIIGVQRFSRVLFVLAVIAMIVSSFLVTNVISTIITEQRRQIGAMKAIGANLGDIFKIYLGIAFIYGVIGTLPALLIGLPVGQWAAHQAAPQANILLEDARPPMEVVILALVLGLGIPVLAAVLPVYQGARITILEAMSDRGLGSSYGKGIGAQMIARFPLPMMVRQALNNLIKRQRRLMLTMLSLSLAAAAFMAMFAVFFILRDVISNIRQNLDVGVNIENLEVLGLVDSLLNAEAEPTRTIQPGVGIELAVVPEPPAAEEAEEEEPVETPDPIVVTGISVPTTLADLHFASGEGWADDPNQKGIVITPTMAREMDKAVGDTLTLSTGDNTDDFPILGIAEYPVETAFMEWQQLSSFVGVMRDAPVPNQYWLPVQIADEEAELWAVGIDEQAGNYLLDEYNPAEPGLILSQAAAAQYDYAVGDTIPLETSEGTQDVPVLGVVEIPLNLMLLLRQKMPPEADDPTKIIAMDWQQLAELDEREGHLKTFYFDLVEPTAERPASATPVYTNQLAFADSIAQTILSVGIVMNFASLLMALVGAIGLLTITSIGVFERQREIGVMRSVGATSGKILGQFLLEGLIVGFLAWLISLPMSYFLSQFLIRTVPFQEVITFKYPLIAPVVGLLSMLVVSIVATLYPSLIAARKTVSEILRYQ